MAGHLAEQLSSNGHRFATEADALARLNEASSRLWHLRTLREGLEEMLAATIELLGADMGNVQLFDATKGVLVIAAQRGFKRDFLEFFREVSTEDDSACGRALRSGERLVVEDVEADVPYTPLRPVARAAGYRAVQSTPLIGRDGNPLGMLSTHWRAVHQPSEQDLRRLDLYVRQAVDFIGRCRAEEQIAHLNADLSRRLEELQTLMEVLPVGIFIAQDATCREIMTNRAGAAMLQLPQCANASKTGPGAERLRFRVLKDGVEVADDDLPMQRAARTGAAVRGEELDIDFEDGSITTLYEYALPLFDDAGQVRGCLGAFVDITERKQAEKALKKADERKDEFLALLAHELRNPLAPILNAVQIQGKLEPTDPRQSRQREVIKRQVELMKHLLDDLLDVSRITRNKIELRLERLDLATVLCEALDMSQPLIEEKQHRLSVSLPPETVWLEADRIRIAEIFTNLLNNAAKYTDPGGRIGLSAELQGGDLLVRVRDTGIGMTPEVLARAFDLFAQADRALDRAQGGLGIGLTIVRRLVEMHGGQVSAHSDGPGTGSQFVVRLPVQAIEEEAPRVCRDSSAPCATPAARRILVVDDNIDMVVSLVQLLELQGHEVFQARDSSGAIGAARAHHPDVIFLDIGLPGKNGYEVAQELRTVPELRQSVLVAITGYGQERDRQRAQEAGLQHHLVKPVDYATIQELLGRLS